jgi:hypothetical protein
LNKVKNLSKQAKLSLLDYKPIYYWGKKITIAKSNNAKYSASNLFIIHIILMMKENEEKQKE